MNKINIPEQKLRTLYADKKLSTYAISKVYKCDSTVIQNRLKEYKIKIRYPKEEIKISKEKLEYWYTHKKLSIYKIAKLYNCGSRTIYGKLVKHRIKTRPVKRVMISKGNLYDMYHTQKLPYSKIAIKYSCTASIIFDKMKKYNILPRNSSEANTIYPKIDFSGNLSEKAYLIGFRLGDLYAYKSSFLVYIKTNTTKTDQAYLFKELFKNYGYVYIKENENNLINMQVNLNSSFSFLIPKRDNIDRWIIRNKSYFLAFLAGYTDAEGNIGVYSNRARFRIRSYDKNLLYLVHKKLNEMNIHNTYGLEMPAGKKYNKDFWCTGVSKKHSLMKLLKLLKQYLKHPKRCKDLIMAEKNLLSRIGRENK